MHRVGKGKVTGITIGIEYIYIYIGIMSSKDERKMIIMIRMCAKNAAAIARPSSKDIVQRISASLRRGLRLA